MDRSGWDFFAELARFGPAGEQSGAAISLGEAEAYCRYVARTHYENFSVASWLIPRRLRQDFYNIYAYCRWADDCADEAADRDAASQLLTWWQGELDGMFRGLPTRHPVMRALAVTVECHALPQTLFDDLISAFAQDQVQQRYATAAELENYCRRSANPVGRLVLGLDPAASTEENFRLSDEICTGLQLANFCQDMARDAAIGRIYAPRELWSQHGVDEAMILAARPTQQLRAMLEAWVGVARERLNRGAELAQRVPRWLSIDVRLFRSGGLAILDEIRAANYDVWTSRPTVSKLRKVRLLMSALVTQ